MWKVLVVICTLGNPCVVFEEAPVRYYSTEKECQVQAETKAQIMMDTFINFGYYVESEAHSCLYINTTQST